MPNLRCIVTQGRRLIGSLRHFCSKRTEPPVNPASKEAEIDETLGYVLYRGFALTCGYVFGSFFIGDRLRQTGLLWQEAFERQKVMLETDSHMKEVRARYESALREAYKGDDAEIERAMRARSYSYPKTV